MKLRNLMRISLLVLMVGVFSQMGRAQDGNSAALNLEILGENPTNLYWDTDTIAPRKPLLLSWRLTGNSGTAAKVRVNWRVLDAAGKRVMSGGGKYDINSNEFAAGRQLFTPKARGAYLWIVQASAKLDGPDIETTQAMPFAVISAPGSASNPFLAVNTSPSPDAQMTDFYQRLGARVWRAPAVGANDNGADYSLYSNVERLAVIPAPADAALADWSENARALLSNNVRSWELASPGDMSLSEVLSRPGVAGFLDNLAQTTRQPAISLQGLWPEKANFSIDTRQFTLQLPVPDADVNSAARRRSILFAQKMVRDMGFGSLALHEGENTAKRMLSPRDSAAAFVQNIVLARALGVDSYSVSLNPTAPQFTDFMEFGSTRQDVNQLLPWERASAFAAATEILGKAQFVKELFAETPAVYCALFQDGDTSLIALWSMQDEKGKLEVHLPGAVLLDASGNEVASANNKGSLTVPLTSDPYFVRVKGSAQTTGEAMRAAAIKGISSVRVQVLPLTQAPQDSAPNVIRVRLHNITPHINSGTLTITPPKLWEVEATAQQFVLQPGQWQIYEFPVQSTRQRYNLYMRANVRVNNGVTGNWNWNGELQVAAAQHVEAKSTFTVDGNLDEWKNAVWMKAQNRAFGRKAQLAVQWDAQHLYVAARVAEPRLAARDENAETYRFWESDGLQLGFGWRDQPWMQPAASTFRDTDYGLLLAPFELSPTSVVTGRVISLWSPTTPFAGTLDHVRWGGAVSGALCAIRFDPKSKETIYEASIPLSALGNVNPSALSNSRPDTPIRFSWIAHTYDGVPVQWSEEIGVYPWWGNSGSFLPARKGYLAAQGLLGFMPGSEDDVATVASPTAPTLPPLPPLPQQPVTPKRTAPKPPPPPVVPEPPQNQVPLLPAPVPVQPIPPDLLPPAPPDN